MSTETVREMPQAGFQFILDDIDSQIQQGMSLLEAVHLIATLGNRIDLSLGLEQLTSTQMALVELAPDLQIIVNGKSIENSASPATKFFLGIWTYGRIWLATTLPADPHCRLVGSVDVPPYLLAAVNARDSRIQQSLQLFDDEVNTFFQSIHDKRLREVLYQVHESIDHTDPVLFYFGELTITNFGKFNNLQSRNGADLPNCFFTRAATMALAEWTVQERTFVFCVYWLGVAGCRGEEFNARQMNPSAIGAYFSKRLRDYRQEMPGLPDISAKTIEAKAKLLRRYKIESSKDLLVYRWINGLTFYKEERLVSHKKLSANLKNLPDRLSNHLAQSAGIDAGSYDSLEDLFATYIARLAESEFGSDEPEMNGFENLLKIIVDCAVEDTGSDVGLTRGFRDIKVWRQAFASKAYEEICNWSAANSYCAVFPSTALFNRLKQAPDTLIKILHSCSVRMQFNSWHYTPGHCPCETVPADRHFYLPPRMSDTAIWSDQHHAGHIHAEVRHTIRCPAAITIDGHEYAGLVDLRLFRQRGHAYSDAELFQAMVHANYVRAAYQALADYLARSDRSFRIDAFDKDWFRRYYSALCTAATIDGSTFGSSGSKRRTPTVDQVNDADMTELFRILHSHASADRVALVESPHAKPETSLAYRELVVKCLALRAALKRFNVLPGACISLLSQRPLHQAVAIIAGLANGVIINPINPSLSAAMLEGQLLHTRPSLLIVDEGTPLPDGLAGNVLSTICGVDWHDVFGDAAPYDVKAVEEALASVSGAADKSAGLLIYTSGTTGDPKGVLLGWNEIYANVCQAISLLGYKPGWIAGSMLPRFHTFTLISDLLPALILGGRAIMVDSFELPRLKSVVDAFRKHGVQSYSAAPIILEACCGLNAWATTPMLRFAVAGAAPLKEKTRISYAAQFGHPIIPCYGLTETSCFATISPPDDVRAGSTGIAAGIEMCVFGDDGEPVANGVTGELAMRGRSVIRTGYFRDSEGRFAKSFTNAGWFLSGDIGRIDSDGYVYVTGRKKNMIIRGGEKIYLEDVDRCIFDNLGVVDCVSIARSQPGVPDQALTFIVTADGKPIPREEIDMLVRRVLTARHIPDRVNFIERVPRTPSGKASLHELLSFAQKNNDCLELQ